MVFEQYDEGKKRTEYIIQKIRPFLNHNILDEDETRESLQSCSETKDKKEFVDGVMVAIDPILVFKKDNPETFVRIKKERFAEQGGYTQINETLYYGKEENNLHIHLASVKDLGFGRLRKDILDGSQKLAEIVKSNEQMKEISATSWIVAKNPKLIEKLGFDVKGEISEEMRKQHFGDDERKISIAVISRE